MTIDNRHAEINLPEAVTKIAQSVQSKIETKKFLDVEPEEHIHTPELPIHRKEVVETNRQKNSELRESIIESTFAISQSVNSDQLRLTILQHKDNPTIDDQREIQRLQTNIERTSNSLNNIKSKSESMYQLTKEVLNDQTKDAMENYVDEKTGLYLMSVISENAQSRIENWAENKNLSPRGYKIIMTDMMLFHTANHRLGTSGLDDRLFTCMQGQIAISKFLDGEKNIYSSLSENEIKSNRYIQKFFPENSDQRKKIEQLKEAGVQISPFRVNAGGGDEFGYAIQFTKELDPEKESEYETFSKEVISHVIESSSLSKDFDVIDDSVKERKLTSDEILDRNEQYRLFCNSINLLKFKSRPERGIVLTPQQIESNSFIDSLRQYFVDQKNNEIGKKIMDPETNISMDFATIDFGGNLPTLEDGLMLTVYGKDSYLDEHKHNKYGLFDENGNFNQDQIEEYTDNLAVKIKNLLSPEDIKKPELVKEVIQKSIISDSIKNIFHILNEEVNEQGKQNKKTNVFLNAISGDPKSILTIGASEQSGRSLYSPDSIEEKTFIIDIIKNYYKNLIQENNQNQSLIKFKQDLESKNINL